jgi:Apolipoprotein A1/A4/E domain
MANKITDNRRKNRLPTLDAPDLSRGPELEASQLRGRPANENDPTTAMMLARLRRPQSNTPYIIAFAISLFWLSGWFATYSSILLPSVNGAARSPADYVQAVTLLLVPIIAMFVIAYFQQKAQQLRQVSEVLMHSAMRLIKPQDIAADNLTSIAQAVRQEVDLLVGGVEHAFQRATSLEEIVHKEIAAVERAFGNNEDRIRSLVGGLEAQRIALQQTSALVNSDAAPMLSRLESNTQNLDQVINLALTTFNRLEDGLKVSTNELARTIEDVAARAAMTGQEIGGHSSEFERMSTTLVSDFRGFASQLQDYVQSLNFTAGNLGNETRKFGTEVKTMESNLLSSLRQSTDQLVVANTEAGQTIERFSTGTLAGFKQTANDLVQSIGGIGENITYHLRSTSENVAELIERSGTDTATRIEQSRGLVTNGLQNVANDFILKVQGSHQEINNYVDRAAIQIVGSVDQAALRLNDQVNQTGAQLVTGLDQAGLRLVEQLGTSGSGFAGRIEQFTGSLAAQLDQHSSNITTRVQNSAEQYAGLLESATSRIETISGSVDASLNGLTSRLTNQLDQHANAVTSRVQNSAEEYAGLLESATSRIETIAGSVDSSLTGATTRLASQLEQHANAVTSRVQNSAELYAGILESATNRIEGVAVAVDASLSSSTNLITSQMQSAGSNINDLLVSTSGTIAAHLKETSEIVSRQMQDSGLALAQNIESSGGLITERLMSVSGDFVHRVDTARDGMLEALTNTAGDLTTKLEDTSVQLFGRLENSSSQIANQLASTSEIFSTTLASNSKDLTSKLRNSASDLFTNLELASTHLTEQLESTAERVNSQIVSTAGSVTERVSTVTEGLTTKLDASTTQLGTLLSSTENRLGNQLEQASTELAALFDVNTRMMTEQLDQTSTAVTNTFAATAVRAAQALDSSSADVTNKIDTASQSMYAKLEGTTRTLGQRFDVATEHLEKVTTDISARLDGTGQRFVDLLSEASGQIFTDLGKARDAFSEGLGETTMQISGRFEQETGLLVDRIDRAATDFDKSASASGSKFDEAAKKFAKHVETANTYLADQLASAAGEIDTRLESVSMQMTGKLEMTGSRISERLDDVSSLVEKSIDKFNVEMEHMLQNRKDTLDSLVADANKRANDVDGVMNSYMGLIEESLNTAESRAQNINRIVSEQTGAALARLEEELRKLETNSNGQVAQAARVLREQHERALSSMNEMLSSTASDFQQTAQDMRITAQQVVKDIDAARGELKRAVIDLPEETRNNADNMRRVVADQISALNALADVVRRQSGSMDYSGPGFISTRTPTGSSSGKSEGTSFNAPVTGTSSAQKLAAERNANASILASIDQAIAARKNPAAPAPKPTPAPAKSAALAKEIESYTLKLHSSARDLVEAIDGSLPRDLEKRYVASDKAVFTQRLYENRSRKMTKLIETRFADDRLLRTRVQAYNRLFEKLLDTLSETPGGEGVMEQVLASEQGRIYVMLAEAAGRMPTQN